MPSSTSPMDAMAGKNRDKGAKKMSRGEGGGGKQQQQSHSFWGAMALKNRSQPGGGGGADEGKNSSSKKTKTKTKTKRSSISISRSMTCAGSICSTKKSSVLSRGSRRSSGGGRRDTSSSRSLKAPDDGVVSVSVSVPASGAAVSASSSFNSDTTVATSTATTVSSSLSALSSPLSSIGAGSRSFRKLSGCYYECHSAAALDPRTSLGNGGAAMLSCADCGEVFMNASSLELHRSTRHAVSELGADNTSRNVVQIIFQSSWLVRKLPAPVCRVERILKVHSSGKTVERFEQYRERVKARAASSDDVEARKSYPRCAADGNELLRFHCTTFQCSLGLSGGTALCRTSPPPSRQCKLCGIIRDGFSVDGDGKIAMMATSGRAHDTAARVSLPDGEKRAMLVCRVVAGRVKKAVSSSNSSEEFGCDSVSSCSEGVYSDLDELFVFNPRAILPCFVVIYSGY